MFIKQCYSSKEINSENKLLGFVATWRNDVTWCNLSRLKYFLMYVLMNENIVK